MEWTDEVCEKAEVAYGPADWPFGEFLEGSNSGLKSQRGVGDTAGDAKRAISVYVRQRGFQFQYNWSEIGVMVIFDGGAKVILQCVKRVGFFLDEIDFGLGF